MEITIIPKEIYTHLIVICILVVGLMKLEVVFFLFCLNCKFKIYVVDFPENNCHTVFSSLGFSLFRFLIPPYRCLICNEHMESIQIDRIQAREYQHSVMKIEKKIIVFWHRNWLKKMEFVCLNTNIGVAWRSWCWAIQMAVQLVEHITQSFDAFLVWMNQNCLEIDG